MIGKREFNENQRNDIITNADNGIGQAEHFSRMIEEWMNQHKEFASSGVNRSAVEYFSSLDGTLNKSKQDINKIFEAAEEVEN
jgi:hypothetical protein